MTGTLSKRARLVRNGASRASRPCHLERPRPVAALPLARWHPAQNRGEVALALDAYAGSLALLGQSQQGRQSPSWAAVAANVGACYRAMADGARSGWERLLLLENALAYLGEALAVREAVFPPGHAMLGETLSLLGGALRAASDSDIAPAGGGGVLAVAERVARRAVVELADASSAGTESLQWATAAGNLAVLLLQDLPAPAGMPASKAMEEGLLAAERSRAAEAEGLLRRTLALQRRQLGSVAPPTIETMLHLAKAVSRAGQGASAQAEADMLRASADDLYAQLQARQAEDESSRARA